MNTEKVKKELEALSGIRTETDDMIKSTLNAVRKLLLLSREETNNPDVSENINDALVLLDCVRGKIPDKLFTNVDNLVFQLQTN